MEKMGGPITITFEESIKLIPTCSGEKDVHQFINACELSVNSISK